MGARLGRLSIIEDGTVNFERIDGKSYQQGNVVAEIS